METIYLKVGDYIYLEKLGKVMRISDNYVGNDLTLWKAERFATKEEIKKYNRKNDNKL